MAKVSFSGKRELRWLQEGECFVTFFEADVEVADSLWNQWLDALIHGPSTKFLLCSWGDIQPTKEQWRKATRAMRDAGKKYAMVTESRHTSALVKAASWAGVDIKAYRWEQLYDASVEMGLEQQQRIAIRATITALRDYFGAVNGDGEVASVAGMGGSSLASTPAFGSMRTLRPEPAPRPVTTIRSTPTPRSSTSAAAKAEPTVSRTPMADAASRNLEQVRQTSEEIQAKLAEIQARLRNRARPNNR